MNGEKYRPQDISLIIIFSFVILKNELLAFLGWPYYILERLIILYAMFNFLGFLFSLLKGIYNTCAIRPQVSEQASVNKQTSKSKLFPSLITQIMRPLMNLTTPDPAHLYFPNLLFTLYSQKRFEPPSTPSPISKVTPTYSLLSSESSDNNRSVNTQISHELDNFITLQQQLQRPQTITIHQLSQSVISSNPSIPTPFSKN